MLISYRKEPADVGSFLYIVNGEPLSQVGCAGAA